MTETTTSKVEKWAYPLKVDGAEVTDPLQYYAALAKAKNGYYPLGANGLWHGGVHFDEATGLVADLTEVRCIADGEVVAYRIDEVYPKSDYGSTQAVYSTGFVLIKHRLEAPSPPAPAPAPGAQPAAAAPGPGLTFFSLYMHLLDWEGYRANPELARPPFWSGGSWQVKATADDKILGLRVRQDRRGKPGYATILSVLPRGTVVETGEEENGWLKVVSITPADPNVPAGTGWIYKREMTASATPDTYIIGSEAKDEMNPPRTGLAVHAAANQKSTTTAILPIGTEVKIGSEGPQGKYQKLLEIVSGNPVPELTASDGILGYIWEGLLDAKNEPAAKDTVHLLDRPYPIKAGSVIGHVGKYQNLDDSTPKNLLHLEVFSCEDVKAFAQLSKSSATRLPVSEKTLVKIPKDTPLITHVQGMCAENPPKVSDPSKKVGYDFMIPVGVLEALPAEKKIKVPVVMAGVTTYTYWWRLDGLLGDSDGNGIDGWFAEPDTVLSRHSPFEWEGFDFIEERVSNEENLAAYLHDLNQLEDSEKETFLPKANASTSGPLKERLYSIVDTDKNEKLTLAEIRGALAKPWFSQPISQLVIKCESEWFYSAEKWNALDELMGHTPEQPNAIWLSEKKRIEHLAWWKSIDVGSEIIWSFNPVIFICAMSTIPRSLICKACGKNIALTVEVMKKVAISGIADTFLSEFVLRANELFPKYGVDTCSQIVHLLGQGKHETQRFTAFRESLIYSRRSYTAESLYRMAPSAIDNGFARLGMNLTRAEKILYIDRNLIANDVGYGKHSFGSSLHPNNDYRGRGLLHLTHYSNYRACALDIGVDIDANPMLVESDIGVMIETGLWYWRINSIGYIADSDKMSMDAKVRAVTAKINTGLKALEERAAFTKDVSSIFKSELGGCSE